MELFEQLYLEHHKRVFNICYRMTRNSSEAEDITQQVFINVFRKIGSFRGHSSFSTWLHRMTFNQVLMHIRAASRREKTTEDGELPESSSIKPQAADIHRVIDRLSLNRAFGNLAEGYRKVIVMHDVLGFDHEEIGQILGCAAGTSKSQLHKARQKLRQILAFNNRQRV